MIVSLSTGQNGAILLVRQGFNKNALADRIMSAIKHNSFMGVF